MNNRISIQITCKDRSSELAVLLSSLLRQTFQDFDLVILDDGSGTPFTNFHFIQRLLTQLKIEGHGVHTERQPYSYGVCKARNLLLEIDPWKENKYVLRVDDDVWLEPDYIERLFKIAESDERTGIVSGITPLLGNPQQSRDTNSLGAVINEIQFNEAGDIVRYGDDCGLLYTDSKIIRAHQFRSCALIRRNVLDDKKIRYELGLTNVGFREEAFLSLRIAWAGMKCVVDTGAIAWHCPASSGGCRNNDYQLCVNIDNEHFVKWSKKTFQEKNIPEGYK